MKTLIQKLPLDENASFVARSYPTPTFETPWHQHEEYELALIVEGQGTMFVGDFIGQFTAGDVFFLGKNLPHWFRKDESLAQACSMVVHFREDFWGDAFWQLPEMKNIKSLAEKSQQGVWLKGKLREQMAQKLLQLEHTEGFKRLSALLATLDEMSVSTDFELLTQAENIRFSLQDQAMINAVFEFSMAHFQRKIRLDEVAILTHKSVSAFCHYFKKSTKKSYIDFLTEIRIAHACKLLANSSLSITEICYESGFQNWANFSKHFKTLMKQSPKDYRKVWKNSK